MRPSSSPVVESGAGVLHAARELTRSRVAVRLRVMEAPLTGAKQRRCRARALGYYWRPGLIHTPPGQYRPPHGVFSTKWCCEECYLSGTTCAKKEFRLDRPCPILLPAPAPIVTFTHRRFGFPLRLSVDGLRWGSIRMGHKHRWDVFYLKYQTYKYTIC